MNKRSLSGNRNFGLSAVGAGKGDADRSPGWRDNYSTIEMPHVPARDDATFSPVPGRPGAYRKTYSNNPAPVTELKIEQVGSVYFARID